MTKIVSRAVSPNALYRMFHAFFELESSGGILLVLCAIAAMVLANNTASTAFSALWAQPLGVTFGPWHFSLTCYQWINDGLMAVFFLVVGLEIKRELLIGELSSPRQALLPIVAAFGGMLVPALIYLVLNPPHTQNSVGWGIPTVTDIAFSLGVLALLGNRVPFSLKVFLVALAIADDLGAVLLIAMFYSKNIDWHALTWVAAIFSAAVVMNRLRIRHALPYCAAGIGMWAFMLHSGVHATLSGILLACVIPTRSNVNPQLFYERAQQHLQAFKRAGLDADVVMPDNEHLNTIKSLEVLSEKAVSPLQSFERALHPWSTYLILPLFAFSNAGIPLEGIRFEQIWQEPLSLGIILGLVFGKQFGVTLFSWLAVRLGWGALPGGVSWRQLYAVSWLAGIGFTMSIFMSNLAFPYPAMLALAKLSVFTASILAAIIGLIVVWLAVRKAPIDLENLEPA